nr:immunoglobulin heavy chain junction region [Mus musculus]
HVLLCKRQLRIRTGLV